MKPSYVSVEYWRETRDDTVTIEGWLTLDAMKVEHLLMTPSIDYDEEITKLAIRMDRVLSIIPAQSVREYAEKQKNDDPELLLGGLLGWGGK